MAGHPVGSYVRLRLSGTGALLFLLCVFERALLCYVLAGVCARSLCCLRMTHISLLVHTSPYTQLNSTHAPSHSKTTGVPYELVTHWDPTRPLLIGGVGQTETRMGVMRLRLKRHRCDRVRVAKCCLVLCCDVCCSACMLLCAAAAEEAQVRERESSKVLLLLVVGRVLFVCVVCKC